MNVRFNRITRTLLATGIGLAATVGITGPAQANPCSNNPTVYRSVSPGHFYEQQSAKLTVWLSQAPCKDASVWAWTEDGTAIRFEDYWAFTKKLTFKAGSTTPQTVTINGYSDNEQEGEETFYVKLGYAQNATVDPGSASAMLIVDGVEPQ